MAGEPVEKAYISVEARVDQLERAMKKTRVQVVDHLQAMDRASKGASATLDKFGRSAIGPDPNRLRAYSASLTQTGNVARNVAVLLAGAFSVREIAQAAEAFTKVQNSLKVTGLKGAELAGVYGQLFQASQRQGASLEATATLYGRLSAAQKELGASNSDLLRFTEGVGLALRVAGTDAQAASGALLQLGQALGGGKIQAEEYNSLLDGARPVLQAVATGLLEAGGSVSKLTALVKDGKVSSEAFFRAFLAGLPTLQRMGDAAGTTAAQATERLKNSLVNLVGQTDSVLGFSRSVATGITSVAGVFDELTPKITAAIKSFQELNATAGQALTKSLDAAKAGTANTQVAALTAQIESLKRQNPAGVFGGDALRLKGLEEQLARARQVIEAGGAAPKAAQVVIGGREENIGRGLSRSPISLKDFKVPGDKGAGGGGAEVDQRAETIKRVIESLQSETREYQAQISTINESNGAKRAAVELAKLSVTATDAERQKITAAAMAAAQATDQYQALIDRQRSLKEASEFAGQSLFEALDGVAFRGMKAKEALAQMVRQLGSAVLQAGLLGSGPLGGIFGNKDSGGIFGLIAKGLTSGFSAALGGGGSLYPSLSAAAVKFHGGGLVGAGGVPIHVPAAAFLNAPRFHGGLKADEMAAVLQRGERVLTANQNVRTENVLDGLTSAVERGGAGGAITVVQNNSFAAGTDVGAIMKLLPAMKEAAKAAVREDMMRGKL